jgi:molecular chaperone GrpE
MAKEKQEKKDAQQTDGAEPDLEFTPDSGEYENLSREDLIRLVKQAKEASDKNYDLYLRSKADIDNIRKRTKKEKEDWHNYANETLVRNLLPSLDNLEKALEHADNENAISALKEGIELTLKGLRDSLSKSGLAEVRALGEPFDPCYHEAVSQIENDQVEPGTVVEELQKGYLLNDRLIRPAVVVVSKPGPSPSADQDGFSARACE